MTVSPLSLTYFHSEKLRCASGQQQASPYRITTYKGSKIGLMGKISGILAPVNELHAANLSDSEYAEQSLLFRLKMRVMGR